MAAAEYAESEDTEKETQPPRELVWYWNLDNYGLPYAGGWMEQPAGWLDRVRQVGWVYRSFKAKKNAKAGKKAAWQRENPAMNRTIRKVEALRKSNAA